MHGAESDVELFVVEGDSAAGAVAATRNARLLTPAIAEYALATFGARAAFSPQGRLL